MKRDLPPYWTTQLAAIIIVFSVGAALFSWASSPFSCWPSYTHYWEPDYTYQGDFQANLTATTPIANVSIGYCDTIEVSDRRADAEVRITLRVYNDTHYLFALLPNFGGEAISSWSFPASVKLHFSTTQNYTVEVEREAEDTFFRCQINAYVDIPPPPVVPVPTFLYSYFGMGAFLILFGLVLTGNFVRRTRTFYWTTSSV